MRIVSRAIVAVVIAAAVTMGVSGIAQAAEPNPTPTNANTGNESPPVSIMALAAFQVFFVVSPRLPLRI